MSYQTFGVHVDVGGSNDALFQVAISLAERFDASVIGLAVCQTLQGGYSANPYLLRNFIDKDLFAIEKEIRRSEEHFRAAFHKRTKHLEWRSMISVQSAAEYLAIQARAVDFIIVDPEGYGEDFPSQRLNVSDLVMRAGRPILVVNPSEPTNFDNVIIGWKDTGEAQRAVANALPFLRKASTVTVVEVASQENLARAREHVTDVSDWLSRHGIKAESFAALAFDDDASRLDMIAKERGAGLMVAGAYGHSRFSEWVLGGVTSDLLIHPERCSLVSH